MPTASEKHTHDATRRSSSENRTQKLRRQQRDDTPAGYVWERADLARTDVPFGAAVASPPRAPGGPSRGTSGTSNSASIIVSQGALRDTLAVCENDAMSKVARARRLRARQGPHSEQSIKRQSWQLASTVASPSLEMLGGVQLPAGMADVLKGGNLGRGANSPAPKEWYACVRACVPEREREHVGRAGSRTGETRSLL